MDRHLWAVVLLATLTSATRADQPLILFNGKDLDGWIAEGVKDFKDGGETKPVWTVHDGLLCCAGKGFGFLRYEKQEFHDFALHVEYRLAARGNSGIGIRTVPFDPKRSTATRPSYAAYEIQLLDDAGKKPNEHGTASLYRYVAPKLNAVKAAPEWNTIDIACTGPRIRIRVNDQEVLDVDQTTVPAIKDKPLKGFISLQNHGSKIDFRNLHLREIKAAAGK